MNHNKRSVHNSGPLGMLVRSGQVKKIDADVLSDNLEKRVESSEQTKSNSFYFRTQSGVEFSEQELMLVDPSECEPWQYANRLEDELGNISELIDSIRDNKQLQPGLIRPHHQPHDGVKYEIIFGRRRHIACSQLGIPFLAIKKEISDIKDAIAFQDAENKLRKDVSNYSNAMLYKRLLDDKVFKTENELAKKLGLPSSTLHDLMAYAKIPTTIVKIIPDIHRLSNSIASKIVSLLNESSEYQMKLLAVASEIGNRISSPVKLEKIVKQHNSGSSVLENATIIKSRHGNKLFTLKINHKGNPNLVLHKDFYSNLNYEHLCEYLIKYYEKALEKSGAPETVA